MYSKILTTVRTTTEASQLNLELKALLESFYQTGDNSFESTLRSKVRVGVASIIHEEVTREAVDPKQYVEGLQNQISALETIELTISFEPTQSSIDKIFSFVNKDRETPLLINLRVNPYVVGGVMIGYKGVYRDFSLARALEEELLAKRASIAKVLFGSTD